MPGGYPAVSLPGKSLSQLLCRAGYPNVKPRQEEYNRTHGNAARGYTVTLFLFREIMSESSGICERGLHKSPVKRSHGYVPGGSMENVIMECFVGCSISKLLLCRAIDPDFNLAFPPYRLSPTIG